MSVYAKITQRNLNYLEGTNVIFDIAYGVVDTVVPKVDPYVVAVPVAVDSPGTWEESFKSAVVSDANAKGYALTLANLRWDFHEPADYRYPQMVASWPLSVTKTDVGTAYVNAYLGNGGLGQLVNFGGFKQYRWVVQVNKIGTGTQTAGLVDVANAANLVEVADAVAAGEHSLDTGWINLPAWATAADFILRPMVKSTLGTDDPVYRQFAFYLR
jgi:hypothetical protein